jgi:thiol-disulfide isomerase/thioredoxin
MFSAYSLWYQGVKSKMWCTLCLAIIATFVLEFMLIFIFSSFHLEANWFGVKYVVVGFAVPIIFLLVYKDTARRASERNSLKRRLNRIYANPEYYRAVMENQPVMPDIPEDMPTVFFGNPEAKNVITIVSNPLCSPCATMHQQLEELIEENPDVKCQVIFLSGENNAGGQIARKLFSLPQDKRAEALSEWFLRNDKNFEKWNEKYTAFAETVESGDFQKMHNHWVNFAEIKGTPTLFINRKMKPGGLNLDELGLMLAMQKIALLD